MLKKQNTAIILVFAQDPDEGIPAVQKDANVNPQTNALLGSIVGAFQFRYPFGHQGTRSACQALRGIRSLLPTHPPTNPPTLRRSGPISLAQLDDPDARYLVLVVHVLAFLQGSAGRWICYATM